MPRFLGRGTTMDENRNGRRLNFKSYFRVKASFPAFWWSDTTNYENRLVGSNPIFVLNEEGRNVEDSGGCLSSHC